MRVLVLYVVPIMIELHIRCSYLLLEEKDGKYSKYCGVIMACVTVSTIWLIWEKL